MEISIDFDTKALDRRLARMPMQLERKLGIRAVYKGANELARQLRKALPKRTGLLRRSIRVKRVPKIGPLFVQVGLSKAARFYGHIIEYGNATVTADGSWRRTASPGNLRLVARTVVRSLYESMVKTIREGGG